MTKNFLNTTFVLTLLLFMGCNTDPLQTAVDDFALVVGLEDITTGVSFAIYDKDTGELIDDDVTIVFDQETAMNTIDIFSDPVDSSDFDGGFYNVGIRNEVVPTNDTPFTLSMTIKADGYLEEQVSVELIETGLTSIDVDLYSESNPPDNLVSIDITAPVDDEGNVLPLPLPVDSTGQFNEFYTSNAKIKELFFSANNDLPNALVLPVVRSKNNSTLKYTFYDDFSDRDAVTTFEGNPRAFRTTARVFTNKGEEHDAGSSHFLLHTSGIQYGVDLLSLGRILEVQIEEAGRFYRVRHVESVVENDPVSVTTLLLAPGITDADSIANDFLDSIEGNLKYVYQHSFNSFQEGVIDAQYLGEKEVRDFFYNFNDYPDLSFYSLSGINSILLFKYPTVISDTPVRPLYFAGESKRGKIQYRITGYGENVELGGALIKSHGRNTYISALPTHGQILTSNEIPLSHGLVEIRTPEGQAPSQRVDLTNYNGEVIELTVPPKDPNSITSSVTVNLTCSNPNEFVRVDNIPKGAASVTYRQVNTTGRFGVANIQNWNYDKTEKKLSGAYLVFKGVKVGTEYDLKITFQDNTETQTIIIEGETFTKEIEAPDNFCSE